MLTDEQIEKIVKTHWNGWETIPEDVMLACRDARAHYEKELAEARILGEGEVMKEFFGLILITVTALAMLRAAKLDDDLKEARDAINALEIVGMDDSNILYACAKTCQSQLLGLGGEINLSCLGKGK